MIFSSDNGGPIYGFGLPDNVCTYGAANNIPLRGGKLSDWEGGIRVNAFVSGGVVPAARRGAQAEAFIHIADWYATLCALAGVEAADEQAAIAGLPPIDSINQWPVITGETAVNLRDEIHVSPSTLISGEWKLLTGSQGEFHMLIGCSSVHGAVPFAGYWPGWGFDAMLKSASECKYRASGCVYNIRDDPSESNDLAATRPDVLQARVARAGLSHSAQCTRYAARLHCSNAGVLQRLMARLAELNKSVFLPDRGNMSMAACAVGMSEYGGFYGPFA
jgi:arylsulfatase I/J